MLCATGVLVRLREYLFGATPEPTPSDARWSTYCDARVIHIHRSQGKSDCIRTQVSGNILFFLTVVIPNDLACPVPVVPGTV